MGEKIPEYRDNLKSFDRKDRPEKDAPTQSATSSSESAPKVKKLDHDNIMEHLGEIPQVRGYRVMLIPVGIKDMHNGIALPRETIERQQNHAQIFRVVGMGSMAYNDESRFPDGPFCEIGDYVLIGRYAGTKVTTYYCDDLRIVNDDEVMAIIPDVESTLDVV